MSPLIDVLILCCIGASAGVLTLLAMGAARVRRAWREAIWSRAYLLAHEHPQLVEQFAEEANLTVPPPAATIDAMSHDELVNAVLTHEENEAQLVAELDDTISGKNAELAAVRHQLRAEEAERMKQERAKRHHWATVKRLKQEAGGASQ